MLLLELSLSTKGKQQMDAALVARFLLPAWLLCGFVVWIGVVSLVLHERRFRWTIRCFCVMVYFSPAVLAGAQEIFWLGITSVAVATGLLAASDRFLPKPERAESAVSGPRVSILGLLALTSLIGIGVAIALQTPPLNPAAWISLATVCLIGTTLSVCVDFLKRSSMRLRYRLPIVCGLVAAATTTADYFDDLYTSLVFELGWPPELGLFTFSPADEWAGAIWFVISASSLLVLGVWLLPRRTKFRQIGRALVVIALLPVAIVTTLLCMPKPQLPTIDGSNAMPRVVGLADKIASSDFQVQESAYLGAENMPVDVRVEALASIKTESDELIEIADQPIWSDLGDGSWDSLNFPSLGSIRYAVRALSARASEEVYYDDQVGARESYLAMLKLASGIERNGIWIHQLVGFACRSIALHDIYTEREYLDSKTRATLAHELSIEPEPIGLIHERERVWILNSGWHSNICLLLNEVTTGDLSLSPNDAVDLAYRRDLTTRRLLAIHLAIDNIVVEQGSAPESLLELAGVNPAILVDPCSPNSQLFRYRTEGDSYKLYSVGPDGKDNGGEKFLTNFVGDGAGFDFELETFFEDRPL